MPISSWWRETAKLYVRYLTAAFASLPAGVAYVYLATKGADRGWPVAALLAAGFGLGMLGWIASAHIFLRSEGRQANQIPGETYNIGASGFGLRIATVAVAATFVVNVPSPCVGQDWAGQKNDVAAAPNLLDQRI